MAKQKNEVAKVIDHPMDEEAVEIIAENTIEEVVEEAQKVNLDTFASINSMKWMVIARIKMLIENKTISPENSLEDWEIIIKEI